MFYLLRALGWLTFAAGALLFIATGGFGGVREGRAVTMVGGVMMPVGMFLTALCTAVRQWRSMHARRAPPEEVRPQPAPEAPKPPEKQYKVRPLKKDLPPSDPGQAE